MKKKLLALVLTGAMTAGMLAGCGDASSAPAADSTAAAAAAETSDAAATTGDAAATSDWATAIKFTASSANSAAPDWSSYDSLI
ncbi:MAG: glycoside hydrolase, partial [Clostridiales bacterium]|nr:glycoside hydrolase [Clostridiales bacterium]